MYNVNYWVKSENAGRSVRASTQGGGKNYQSDQTTSTDWSEKSWNFVAKGAKTRFLFNLGLKANTYYTDEIKITDASLAVPLSATEATARVDNALKIFITGTVTHYKGKVNAWDVVNEPVTESGALRVRANANVEANATDYLFWADYLGRDWSLKAFQYAAAADPTALLFINDFNLESCSAKLDGLLAYVKELQAKGAKIGVIGTQMHLSINTSKTGIINMFQKLVATGLKVRISELDVRINPADLPNFTDNALALSSQAAMCKFVIDSYLKYVPVA